MPTDAQTPAHYAGKVTPWDLQKCMKSSGNAFVDARRTDAIEYAFRLKEDLLGDLKKARHCLDEAIKTLEEAAREARTEGQLQVVGKILRENCYCADPGNP